jgi:RNA polymerase sigma-70 factor (ECF subfamily)
MATDEHELVERLRRGDAQALATAFADHQERLRRLASYRLAPGLNGRVDAEDVLQESYLAAMARLKHFQESSSESVFVWLRLVVLQTITDIHRKHLGAQMRDAYREVGLPGTRWSPGSSASLAAQLAASLTSPSQAAIRDETSRQLEAAIETMSELDREILELRHFEELSNQEAAEVLGIEEKAASIRYVRAIKRLKDILASSPGSQEGIA